MNKTTSIDTPRGVIKFPAYVPATTLGENCPLDKLMRPYLNSLSPAIRVSYYYAEGICNNSFYKIPLMIDSGGFAALCPDARIIEKNGQTKIINPYNVIEFQQEQADIAFTLDFPIPVDCPTEQAQLRHRLTIANALWAVKNRENKQMKLYACIQAWDAQSARKAAQAYAGQGFDGIAIGGIVSFSTDLSLVKSIIMAVREVITDLPLHVFGVDTPSLVLKLFAWGASSIDSSSYLKLAMEGKLYGMEREELLESATTTSPLKQINLAACNLSIATGKGLPLCAIDMALSTLKQFEK